MRALILGGAGMLGHKLWQTLRERIETFTTLRQTAAAYQRLRLFDPQRVIDRVDVGSMDDLHRAFGVSRPDVVFNAVGIIKQLREAHDPIRSLEINALLPHRLAGLCSACGARLIHVSTDCVFSGRRGYYTESDNPDPTDLYGRTKLLGEVESTNCVTVRTSMIGREIATRSSLVEWFLSQHDGAVRGFTRAIYSGFTTLELARVLAAIAEKHVTMSGTWQVSSDPISKYDLLHLVNDAMALNIRIEPDDTVQCDRSLDSTRFRLHTGYHPPSWRDMIAEMRDDPTPYDNWKNP